ncbi:hypothetical protein F4779DRAFT_615333 [Xylariaceae sp. FL0662B]|nr:hypothetical protein F4779DRAFT_615333 [Xylariaceae sp. FL0662B]
MHAFVAVSSSTPLVDSSPSRQVVWLLRRHTVIVDIASLLKGPDSDESSLSPQHSRSTSVVPPSSTATAATATGPVAGPPSYAVPRRLGGGGGGPGKRSMPPHASESPAKKQSKWSAEEDALIIELRGSGMKWEDISQRLPGRSAISCRLHYQNYLERRSEWDEERKNKLARLYERFKPEMWQKVADEMSVPWRAAEAMHWYMGEHEMARRAGTTPFTLSTANLDAPQGGSRASRHSHSHSHGSLPRDVGPGRGGGGGGAGGGSGGGGYGKGTTMPPGRPLASRRETLPPQLPFHPEHVEGFGYHTQHGAALAPIQTQSQPPRPGMLLPGVAELTTGVSPYSTPAYSVGVPSASPVHSATGSPAPFMPTMGYPPLEPASSKRRRSPETRSPETSRRRHFDVRGEPYDKTIPRHMP